MEHSYGETKAALAAFCLLNIRFLPKADIRRCAAPTATGDFL